MKIFGAKAVVIQFLIALVGVVTDLAMLYCIHHLIKKNWVRLLMALVVPVIPFAYRRTNYWQLQPHRLVFPMLLAAICCSVCEKSSRKKRLGSGAAGFCACWQCCGAPRVVCSVSSLVRGLHRPLVAAGAWYARGQWERYGALLLGAVLAVLGAIGLTNLYNLPAAEHRSSRCFFTRCTAAIIWMVPSATRLS